jgi:hypothetical protein
LLEGEIEKKNIQVKKNKENEPSQPTLTCQIYDPVSRDRDNPIKKIMKPNFQSTQCWRVKKIN